MIFLYPHIPDVNTMKVIDLIRHSTSPLFSIELLPPIKGNSIEHVYNIVDKLRDFDPKFINITSHHSECIYRPMPDGTHRKMTIRRRPGTVAVAAALKYRYGITPVPHIICNGFTREETEYALLDLNFLEITNLFVVRGDDKPFDRVSSDASNYNRHAIDLQLQINDFNAGRAVDESRIEGIATPFSYGMACYPEKHEEAPNMASDIHFLKEKVKNGADYLITQMFFDNEKFYSFIDRCRAEGITVPIIPGIKPLTRRSHLNMLPKTFRTEMPDALVKAVEAAGTDEAVRQVGIEWATAQAKDLLAHNVPGIHFYTINASDSVREIARNVF